MNYKSSFKYQQKDMRRAVIVFYIVIASVIVFMSGVSWFTHNMSWFTHNMLDAQTGSTGSAVSVGEITSLEIGSVIFLFVLGMNSFREVFRMLIQNGFSRKTIFAGRILSFLMISVIMAFIDTAILIFGHLAQTFNDILSFRGLYGIIYPPRPADISAPQMYMEVFLLNICMYIAALTIGYFITIGYYRMKKLTKIIVSVSVPCLLFYILPAIDQFAVHNALQRGVSTVYDFCMGVSNVNPYSAMVTLLLTACIFSALCWLLIKKAVVKEVS